MSRSSCASSSRICATTVGLGGAGGAPRSLRLERLVSGSLAQRGRVAARPRASASASALGLGFARGRSFDAGGAGRSRPRASASPRAVVFFGSGRHAGVSCSSFTSLSRCALVKSSTASRVV